MGVFDELPLPPEKAVSYVRLVILFFEDRLVNLLDVGFFTIVSCSSILLSFGLYFCSGAHKRLKYVYNSWENFT